MKMQYRVHTFEFGLNGDKQALNTVRCNSTADGRFLYLDGQRRRIHSGEDGKYIQWKGKIFRVVAV